MHCLNSSSTAVRAVAAARWWSSSSGGGGSFFSLWRRSGSRFGPFNKSKFVGSARGVPPLPSIEQLPPGTGMADASARYQQVRWKHLGSEYVRFIMMTLVLSSRQFFRNTITIIIIFLFPSLSSTQCQQLTRCSDFTCCCRCRRYFRLF